MSIKLLHHDIINVLKTAWVKQYAEVHDWRSKLTSLQSFKKHTKVLHFYLITFLLKFSPNENNQLQGIRS